MPFMKKTAFLEGEQQRRQDEDKVQKKQKPKRVPLSAAPTKVPGRLKCDCQATRHELIANCLSCGRIVCAQEGEGPCIFCDAPVVRDREARYQALLDKVENLYSLQCKPIRKD